MSMDLSKYQKVKADEKFSVLRHANGSEFKIAHEGLSPEIASRIHKMPMFEAGGALGSAESYLSGSGPGGITGAASTALGAGENAPQATTAQTQNPQTAAGVQNATANALGQQTQLAGTAAQVSSAGGVANQNLTLDQGDQLYQQLGSAGGVQNQQAAAQGLQSNASQLQGIANGTGPNPAQNMLNQQTGANVSNQAALMAGQRGASANPALLARQAAQQGAATQQQAVGQAATLQSQQQLGAIGQEAGVNQALAGVGAGQVGQAQGQLAQNAATANNQVVNTIGANTAAVQGAQNEQQTQAGALNTQNANNIANQGSVNSANTTLNNTGLQGKQGLGGGLLGSAGSAIGSLTSSLARGGKIGYDTGGNVDDPNGNTSGGGQYHQMVPVSQPPAITALPGQPAQPAAPGGPQSSLGTFLQGWSKQKTDKNGQTQTQSSFGTQPGNAGAQALNQGAFNLGNSLWAGMNKQKTQPPGQNMAGPDAADTAGAADPSALADMLPALAALAARGGKIRGLVSEGEVVIPPKDAKNPAAAARDVAQAKEKGGEIKAKNPSEKAVKSGNSYANDKIEKDLPVGGIVIPRSVMQSKDPIRGAAEFVKAVMKKKGGK